MFCFCMRVHVRGCRESLCAYVRAFIARLSMHAVVVCRPASTYTEHGPAHAIHMCEGGGWRLCACSVAFAFYIHVRMCVQMGRCVGVWACTHANVHALSRLHACPSICSLPVRISLAQSLLQRVSQVLIVLRWQRYHVHESSLSTCLKGITGTQGNAYDRN